MWSVIIIGVGLIVKILLLEIQREVVGRGNSNRVRFKAWLKLRANLINLLSNSGNDWSQSIQRVSWQTDSSRQTDQLSTSKPCTGNDAEFSSFDTNKSKKHILNFGTSFAGTPSIFLLVIDYFRGKNSGLLSRLFIHSFPETPSPYPYLRFPALLLVHSVDDVHSLITFSS